MAGQAFDTCSGWQLRQHFRHGFPEKGMTQVGSNIHQRYKDKSSLMQVRMGDDKIFKLKDFTAVKKQVHIE